MLEAVSESDDVSSISVSCDADMFETLKALNGRY